MRQQQLFEEKWPIAADPKPYQEGLECRGQIGEFPKRAWVADSVDRSIRIGRLGKAMDDLLWDSLNS